MHIGSIFQHRTIKGLKIRRVNLRERGLITAQSRGIRIGLVTDIHARDDWFEETNVRQLVEQLNALDGIDFVAHVGDFTGDDPSPMEWLAPILGSVRFPSVATLGNHDHWAGARSAERLLEANGIPVLTNRSISLGELIGDPNVSTKLVGIDSCWTRKNSGPGANPEEAFSELDDLDEAIVLGHEPFLATMHGHALHLAGHTHCGQVRSPILGDWTARMHMPRYSEPFPNRLYETDVDTSLPPNHRSNGHRRWVYTSAGVGFSSAPFRFLCPPEIVIIDA